MKIPWLSKRSAERHTERAWGLLQSGNSHDAREEFALWAKLEPGSAPAWFGYGWSSFQALAAQGAAEADMDHQAGTLRGPGAATLVVGGGAAGPYSAIIPMWSGGTNSRSVTRRVQPAPT